MKKLLSVLLLAALLLSALALTGCGGKDTLTLNVYNWGEYISDGSEDSLDTIKAFEEWYEAEYGQKIKVNYTTYASNEDMYAKLSSGAVSESFRGLFYDPDNKYTVPYTYGVVGVIYNAKVVDEADAGDWDLMWNEKYAGDILQFNNSRDAFGTAQYKLGLDVNSSDRANWDAALEELKAQSPLVKSYVMDEIYNMMASGEAAVGAYYVGDYFTMLDMVDEESGSVDLRFYYPERTNFFVDAMCIPSCCQHKELAEIFINYMLSEEPAVANAEYIYYASPNSLVYNNPEYLEELGEDTVELLYRFTDDFSSYFNAYAYRNLDAETLDYITSLWETLKIA